jgi:hypothetical protein
VAEAAVNASAPSTKAATRMLLAAGFVVGWSVFFCGAGVCDLAIALKKY